MMSGEQARGEDLDDLGVGVGREAEQNRLSRILKEQIKTF